MNEDTSNPVKITDLPEETKDLVQRIRDEKFSPHARLLIKEIMAMSYSIGYSQDRVQNGTYDQVLVALEVKPFESCTPRNLTPEQLEESNEYDRDLMPHI